MKTEIEAVKGEATVFAAHAVDRGADAEILVAFRKAREPDYRGLFEEVQALLSRTGDLPPRGALRRKLLRRAQKLRERASAIQRIDYFGAPGRDDVERALEDLMERLEGKTPKPVAGRLRSGDYRGKLWVTRPRPGIDRMASAWLIKRFIDSRARFAFMEKPPEKRGAVPFDMYGVELSHHGSACTFETLAARFGVQNPAVTWLGRIVNEIDFKGEVKAEPEAAGIGRLVEGLRKLYTDDQELLERGAAVFEALYLSRAAEPKKEKRTRRR